MANIKNFGIKGVAGDIQMGKGGGFVVYDGSNNKFQFKDSGSALEDVEFAIAYSFMYSPRPGTPSFNLKDIDKPIKKARLSALQSLLKKQQIKYNNSFIGKNINVLFDRKGRHNNQYIGRSIYNQSVFTTSNENLIGKITDTNILRSTDFALEAKI